MKNILTRPAVLHGIMAGLVLLAIKIVLAVSGNWSFRLQTTYNVLAFLLIILAIVFSGITEKRKQKSVSYGKALLNALTTILICVFLSLLGDQIAYRTQSKLAENAMAFQLEIANDNLNKMTMFSDSYKEKFLSTLENADPKDLYSITAFISSWLLYSFLNGIWALAIAAFTRKRKDILADDLLE
jgi:hypothetical protein